MTIKKPSCGVLAGEPVIIGERCADGGKCHHGCTAECWRRDCCVPLTDSGLNDDWSAPGEQPAPMLCPGCNQPMLDGQTFSGAYGCHWDCTDKVREQERRDNPRPPTESDKRWDKLKKSIEEVASLATRLEKENGQLRGLLRRIVATYDAKPSMHLIIAEARQVLGQPVSRYSQKAIEAGKTGKVCGK